MHEPTDRREFVRTIVIGASAGALLAPPAARADEPQKKASADEPQKKASAKEENQEKKESEKSDAEKLPSEVDARMALVLARFGKQLDAEARKTVRSEIESIVRRAEELRKVTLSNGDGPFPVFVPYRAPVASA
jgi:hypothetical protein